MNHVGALRVSLLLAIGVVPVACGGTVQRGNQDGEGADTGTGGSGITGSGGTKNGTAGRSMGSAGTAGKMLPPSGGTGAGGATQTTPSCSGKLDALTGMVRCIEGYVHRVKQVECVGAGGAPADASAGASSGGAGGEADPPAKTRANGSVPCGNNESVPGGYSDEDCSGFDLGYCSEEDEFEAVCVSGCRVDEDCGGGAICECGHAESPSGGVCIRAVNCRTDADCAAGLLCASFEQVCAPHAFACQSPDDECRTSADCGDGFCDFTPNGEHRFCDAGVVCGRPFLVDCTARVASVVQSHDWSSASAAPCVEHLTSSQRETLALHWTRLGQMEHASIAAFARFNLQLLSLGAPSELVEQCTRALADETAHTKLCFQLASAYAGRALGPGPLDIAGSLTVTSLEGVVDLVLAEGCIGETGAALEALEAADSASDPVIRAAYAQIAADEQRHAELAFRFMRWALEQDAALVEGRIVAALASNAMPSLATRAVVEPCLSALLTRRAAA
jgi:hypothetical protein